VAPALIPAPAVVQAWNARDLDNNAVAVNLLMVLASVSARLPAAAANKLRGLFF
jgi:hypothetical protein